LSSEAAEPASDPPVTGLDADEQAASSAGVKVESRRKIATKRILVWLLFGAFFGLMPIFAVTLKEVFSPQGFSIDELLKSGELFIVSAVLSAGAIGELLAAASRGMSFYLAVISGFFCLAAFAGDTIAYVVAENAPPAEITVASLWFFPLTLLSSGLCVGRRHTGERSLDRSDYSYGFGSRGCGHH
jgi:hypothetical protein